MTTKNLTRAQARKLCAAAQTSWNRRSRETPRVEFNWKGERYIVTRVEAEFRLHVETPDGQPVASIYD
jgi:hypothetical protein